MNQLCQQLGLLLARFALSAWVGAAVLFVINGIRLVTLEAFDSVDRDHIALVRFPPYYVTGAVLMLLALTGLLAARQSPVLSGRRWTIVFVLTLLASLVMLGDYFWVYTPLAAMITPPGATRPISFRSLHLASELLNTMQVALCLAAALIANWPRGPESGGDDKAGQ